MSQACEHLERLLALALAEGCSIFGVSEGWSEAKRVLELMPRMPKSLREVAGAVEAPVEYYAYEGSPHTPPDEGFFCRSCKVGMSFPLPHRK